jgi:hypothetical protein
VQRRKWNAEREALLARKPAAPEPVPPPPAPDAAAEAGVVQFLARLQEKGRLVDFLMEDITPHSNEQVGVVGRVVHQGCREVLRAFFDIRPVHEGKEQAEIFLAADFDAAAYRLVGKVPQHPPYQGTVRHHGWKTVRISLPRLTDTSRESASDRMSRLLCRGRRMRARMMANMEKICAGDRPGHFQFNLALASAGMRRR